MKDYIIQTNLICKEDSEKSEYEIGKIINKHTNEDCMYLIYSKIDCEQTGLHFHVLLDKKTGNDNEYPFILMDEYYRDLFYYKPELFEALAMHELGHVLNGDLTPEHNYNRSPEEIMNIRMNYILRGDVMPEELAADRFAIKQCGKRAVIKALDQLIKRRIIRNDPVMEFAIKELNNRKKAVQNSPKRF